MTNMYIPTQRLYIKDLENWETEAREFAKSLVATENTRQPCFEIWYPPPAHLLPSEQIAWKADQANFYDAIQFDLDAPIEDAVKTLPPYSEMTL